MKIQKRQPWLTSTGEEIRTPKLKRIARFWGNKTWARYLDWFESPGHEKLIRTGVYKKLCEIQTESIFEQFGQSANFRSREICESLLKDLPPLEAQVLRLTFFEGRTQRQIGTTLGLSQFRVFKARKRALTRLRRAPEGAKAITRQYMKGENLSSAQKETPIWDKSLWKQPPFQRVPNPGRYDAKLHREEIEKIEPKSVRIALAGLAEDEQRMVYLRYWCCRSVNQIARELGIGINLVEQISDAALSRVKRKVIQLETGHEAGGESSCR